MEFLPSITAARGRAVTWTPEQADEKLRERGHTLCERLHSGCITRLYFDADRWCGDATGAPPSDSENDGFLRETRELLDTLVDVLRDIVIDIGDDVGPDIGYVLAQRHGVVPQKGTRGPGARHKLSLRAFLSGVTIPYHNIPKLLAALPALHPLIKHFDMSVYKPEEQLLACVHGCKGALSRGAAPDTRVLEPLDPALDTLCFVVQHFLTEWPVLGGLDDVVLEGGAAADVAPRSTGGVAGGRVDDRVTRLAGCLGGDTSRDRDKWVGIGILLKIVLGECTDRYLPAFLVFSRKAAEGVGAAQCNYIDDADCVATWRSFKPRATRAEGLPAAGVAAARRQIGLGTLCRYARADSPAAYAAWRAAEATNALEAVESDVLMPLQAPPGEWAGMVMALASRWGEVFGAGLLNATTCAFERLPASAGIRFRDTDSGVSGTVCVPDMGVTLERADGTTQFMGLLYPDVPVTGSLDWLHDRIHSDAEFTYNRDSMKTATLTAVAPHENCARIMLSSPLTEDSVAHIAVAGRSNFTVKGSKMLKLNKRIEEAIRTHMMAMVDPDAQGGNRERNWVTNMFNYGTINGTINVNIAGFDPDADRHNDEEIASLFVSKRPDLVERIKFVPDAKVGSCNGVWFCDLETNVWAQRHNASLEQIMLDAMVAPELGAHLTDADRRHIMSRRGRADMLYCAISKCITTDFETDNNLDVFPFSNGVFEMPTGIFRPLLPADRISMTTRWAYDPELARAHRAELEAFLAQLLPVEAEREVVLAFIASLLSGRRALRHFLALTDRRNGANGKTTLVSLLEAFFGVVNGTAAMRAMMVKDQTTTKLVCKGAYDRGRDQHDEGLKGYTGVRLVVADELSDRMTLDEQLIKTLTGGVIQRVGGRGCGASDRFGYTWQAGIMVLFNEGQFPQFNAADGAFMDRMIVVPMRSKFVPEAALSARDAPPLTFKMDPHISSRFALWRSALADLMRERFTDTMPPVPASMREWKHEVASDRNGVAEWLQEFMTVTGDEEDVFTMSTVKEEYIAHKNGIVDVPRSKITGLASAYIAGLQGVTIKKGARVDGACARGVVCGATLRTARG